MAELVPGQSAVPVGMKPDGFADALHRVRQMAAKIDIPHLNNSGALVDPSMYGYGVQKRSLDDGGKMTIAFSSVTLTFYIFMYFLRAVMTEEFKVPDKMVGFIIGRGGEQISRIQTESGCKIQIAPDSGGMPERSCVLTGAPESIEHAKRLLGQIVDRCRNGPGFHNDMDGNSTVQEILIPASKVGLVIGKGGETIKQLQERTGVKMIMIQDGPLPTGADKPLRITGDPFKVQQARDLVLEIIREKDQIDFRGVRSDFSSRMGGGSVEVSVPRFAVGIVIGRNGEMIKKIQNDAGVRIQFKPDDGISPERVAQVMGLPERCQHAAHIINELIITTQERDGFGSLAMARGRGRSRDWNIGTPGGMQEITYTVPADKCGLVIGKGGENIKSINQQSGAHVELQRNPPPNTDPGVRIFTIRGVPQQIELARHLIDEKVGGNAIAAPSTFGQSPFNQAHATPHQNGPQAFVTQGWGSTYQAWQQPGQQHPAQAATATSQPSSQPDYTMAWAEYYRQQAAYYGQSLGQTPSHSQEQ
uniref:Far upstream element binding protein 3 n=1 Tax=Leptobrachium leishanense TaxID=445787 RepID=A0A8C5Q933_9ANUR